MLITQFHETNDNFIPKRINDQKLNFVHMANKNKAFIIQNNCNNLLLIYIYGGKQIKRNHRKINKFRKYGKIKIKRQ